ncbi:MAG: hypothetical protein HRT87_00095 [Legionellales bacterium]|nr:hypothetical protein [Legionellales bacterium]
MLKFIKSLQIRGESTTIAISALLALTSALAIFCIKTASSIYTNHTHPQFVIIQNNKSIKVIILSINNQNYNIELLPQEHTRIRIVHLAPEAIIKFSYPIPQIQYNSLKEKFLPSKIDFIDTVAIYIHPNDHEAYVGITDSKHIVLWNL